MACTLYYEEYRQDGSKIRGGVLPVPLASVQIDTTSAHEHVISAGAKTARITIVGTSGISWDFVAAASLGGDADARGQAPNTSCLYEIPTGATKVSAVAV